MANYNDPRELLRDRRLPLSQALPRNKQLLVAGAAVLATTMVLVWRFLAREESLWAAANSVNDCIHRMDANCVLRYTSKDEISALGLTESRMAALLKAHVETLQKGFLKQGNLQLISRDAGEISTTQSYESADRVVDITIVLIRTDDGPKMHSTTLTLGVFAGVAREKGTTRLTGAKSLQAMAAAARVTAGRAGDVVPKMFWRKSGAKQGPRPGPEVLTWVDFAASREAAVSKVRPTTPDM